MASVSMPRSGAARQRTNTIFNVYVNPAPVLALISGVEKALRPASLALFLERDAKEHLADEIELRFVYEGDRKSGNWPALSPATESIRRSQGFSEDEINVRTGDLLEFITHQYELTLLGGGAMLRLPGSPPSQELKKKLEHAQRGAPTNPIPGYGPTPPRPVLAVDATDMAVLLELLQLHIIKIVTGSAMAAGL